MNKIKIYDIIFFISFLMIILLIVIIGINTSHTNQILQESVTKLSGCKRCSIREVQIAQEALERAKGYVFDSNSISFFTLIITVFFTGLGIYLVSLGKETLSKSEEVISEHKRMLNILKQSMSVLVYCETVYIHGTILDPSTYNKSHDIFYRIDQKIYRLFDYIDTYKVKEMEKQKKITALEYLNDLDNIINEIKVKDPRYTRNYFQRIHNNILKGIEVINGLNSA